MTAVGFTGTQQGMTAEQAMSVRSILAEFQGEFHHGDCEGADEQAHAIAVVLGYRTVSHPPEDDRKRAFTTNEVTLDAKPYLDRNTDIAEACDVLIAAPKESVEVLRSGTWATVRRARQRHKRIALCYPSGEITWEA